MRCSAWLESPHIRGRFFAGCAIAFVVAPIIGGYFMWRTQIVALDDASISFHYAKNLVTGHGLVFNPGERVEGVEAVVVAAGHTGRPPGVDEVVALEHAELQVVALDLAEPGHRERLQDGLALPTALRTAEQTALQQPQLGPPAERGFRFMPYSGSDYSLLIVQNARFEINQQSATTPFKSDYFPGMFALSGDRPLLICIDDHRTMFLKTDGTPLGEYAADFMFGDWRLVCGSEKSPIELFSSSTLRA